MQGYCKCLNFLGASSPYTPCTDNEMLPVAGLCHKPFCLPSCGLVICKYTGEILSPFTCVLFVPPIKSTCLPFLFQPLLPICLVEPVSFYKVPYVAYFLISGTLSVTLIFISFSVVYSMPHE